MKRWKSPISLGLVIALIFGAQSAWAAIGDPSSASTSYKIQESFLGGTGDVQSGSTNYKSVPAIDDGGSTLGDNFVGNSASTSYQANSGFNTTAQPSLTFVINQSSINLGTLTTAAKSTATATFNVKNYTSYGYVVKILGAAPTYGGHQLSPLATDTASAAGTEQYGVNVVNNPSAGVGANPVQNPTGPPTFGFGVAGDGSTSNYIQADKWRYVAGETVASAPKSSGETDYTMTFMANISNGTPGGKYTGSLVLVATGTF